MDLYSLSHIRLLGVLVNYISSSSVQEKNTLNGVCSVYKTTIRMFSWREAATRAFIRPIGWYASSDL
jgi:hypothetical protein